MKHTSETYVNDILTVRFDGLRLIFSKAASREAEKYDLNVDDCKRLLKEGYDAPHKRKKGTVERWYHRKNKIWNIVVSKSQNIFLKEEVYLIIHIGCFTRKR